MSLLTASGVGAEAPAPRSNPPTSPVACVLARAILLETGDHRILTAARVTPRGRRFTVSKDTQPPLRGVVMDVQTTGLDGSRAALLEIAAVPFTFDRATGAVDSIGAVIQAYNDPAAAPVHPGVLVDREIPDRATELTGITKELVAGHVLDPAPFVALLRETDVVVCHHARYDRAILARYLGEALNDVLVACSSTQIAWAAHGYRRVSLDSLAQEHARQFLPGYSAVDHCAVLLGLLDTPFADGTYPLGEVMGDARRKLALVWAPHTRYETNGILKDRGYAYHSGTPTVAKAWYRILDRAGATAEMRWLRQHIYGGTLPRDFLALPVSPRQRFASVETLVAA